MQILRLFDLTGSYRATAELCRCSPDTVARFVNRRDRDQLGSPGGPIGWPSVIDPQRPKIAELVERSRGRIRADIFCQKLRDLGYKGSERAVRRAVAEAKRAYRKPGRRIYRRWISKPGMWAQWDRGDAGPIVEGAKVYLFCAWLSWSRLRVVIPARNRELETLICCLDRAMRVFSGVPSYWLTDFRSARSPRTASLGSRCVTRCWPGWATTSGQRSPPANRPTPRARAVRKRP